MNMVVKSINEARILAKILNQTDYQQILLSQNIFYPKDVLERFEMLKSQFYDGYPMDYILGETEFLGNMFSISPGVLIPRPETEYWVNKLKLKIESNPSLYKDKILIDLCCGSGVISLSLAKYFKKVVLIDLFDDPINCSKKNLSKLNIKNAEVLKMNLLYEVSNFFQANLNQFKIKNTSKKLPSKVFLNFGRFDGNCSIPVLEKYLSEIHTTKISKDVKKRYNKDSDISKLIEDLLVSDYLLVSNPPYVPNIDRKNVKENMIEYEPDKAIFSDYNGLWHFYEIINCLNLFVQPIESYFELDIRQFDIFFNM